MAKKNSCKAERKSQDLTNIIGFYKQYAADQKLSEKYEINYDDLPWYGKVIQSLSDKLKDNVVSQEDLDKTIKRFVKNKDEQFKAKLLLNFRALLENNAVLANHFYKYINYEVNERILSRSKERGAFNTRLKTINGEQYKVPVISDLPLPVIRQLYNTLYNWATVGSDLKLAPGIIGTVQLEVYTPRMVQTMENTGSIFKARKATENFAMNAEQITQYYLNGSKALNG